MIRVAIVAGPVHSGGKKNLMMEYYRHIDRNKVQMDFICNSDSNSIPKEEIESLGGRVFLVPPFSQLVAHVKALDKLFAQEKWEVLHAYDSMMNIFPLWAAKKHGTKVRISESLSMAAKGEWKTYVKYMLRPLSHLYATHFMSCGIDCGVFQFGQKAYDEGKIAVFKTVINTEANAYDPELREKTRKQFGWENKRVYGFIGRFVPQKNPIFLMDICGAIARKQPEAHFAFIGFGELEEQMWKRADELGSRDKVEYLGRREDIKQFYNAFDAFLLPSRYEGLPVVGLESQSCGLPIFFSTEITPEAKACDMAEFISLDTPMDQWADMIINKVNKNINERRSYVAEVKAAGFDSHSEAQRMQKFYLDAWNKANSEEAV